MRSFEKVPVLCHVCVALFALLGVTQLARTLNAMFVPLFAAFLFQLLTRQIHCCTLVIVWNRSGILVTVTALLLVLRNAAAAFTPRVVLNLNSEKSYENTFFLFVCLFRTDAPAACAAHPSFAIHLQACRLSRRITLRRTNGSRCCPWAPGGAAWEWASSMVTAAASLPFLKTISNSQAG